MKYKRFIIRGDHVRKNCIDYLSNLAASEAEPIEVVVQPYIDAGTTAQKRLYWALVGEIADELGYDKENMSNTLKALFCTPDIVVVKSPVTGELIDVEVLPSISTMKKDALSALVGHVEQFAAEHGVRVAA